jgi:antitoxin VapB
MEGRNVKHARLFREGANQVLRIPREFEFNLEEVTIRREGTRLIIEPLVHETLAQVLDSLEPIDETLDTGEDLPPAPE